MNKTAATDFPVHDLVAQRWSPRAFAERTVAREDLGSLFEAARWAASSYNEQPWRFVVATRDEPEAFEALASCLVPFNAAWAAQAPVLAFSLARTTFERNGKPNAHAWHDVGLALGNLTLEAQSRGLVLHQMAGFDAARAREVLGLPADVDPVAAFALGYAGEPDALPEEMREGERAPRTRKPLAELVHVGTLGGASPF